jgi:hypothetical protein
MFTLANRPPHAEHRLTAFRLVGLKSAAEKAGILRDAAGSGILVGEEVLR